MRFLCRAACDSDRARGRHRRDGFARGQRRCLTLGFRRRRDAARSGSGHADAGADRADHSRRSRARGLLRLRARIVAREVALLGGAGGLIERTRSGRRLRL